MHHLLLFTEPAFGFATFFGAGAVGFLPLSPGFFGSFQGFSPLEQFELQTAFGGFTFGGFSFDGFAFGGNSGGSSSLLQDLRGLLLSVLPYAMLVFKRPRLLKGHPYQHLTALTVRYVSEFLVTNTTQAQLPQLPLLLALLAMLGCYNLGGLFPYNLTLTAHLLCTLFFGGVVFFGLNCQCAMRYGLGYFNLFLPQGTPFKLLPLIVLLEVVSYASRPFSLALRLFANLMAGHALLNILLDFGVQGLLGPRNAWPLALLGLGGVALILVLEYMVGLLQIFVLLTLVSLYLADVHNPMVH